MSLTLTLSLRFMYPYGCSSAGRGDGRGAMPFLMSFALEHEIETFAWIDNASVQFPLNIYATKGWPTGQAVSPLRLSERTVPGNLRLEIAQARPFRRLVEVHFSHNDRSPFLGQGDRFSCVIENGRDHPVARDVFVGAADQIDVVLRRARACQFRIAAPHGPGNHFCAAIAQFPRDLG